MAAPAGSHGKIERAIPPVGSPRAFARLVRSLRCAPRVPLIFPPQTLRQIRQSCSDVPCSLEGANSCEPVIVQAPRKVRPPLLRWGQRTLQDLILALSAI